ncbi:hypothetical protein EE612_056510, partial [Oryza sativa]
KADWGDGFCKAFV